MDTESKPYVSYTFNSADFGDNPNIIRHHYQTNKAMYSIINQDSQLLPDGDITHRKFRSVIMTNEPTSSLLAFTPPKSITYENFTELNPIITQNMLITEIIEGTMVTLFYDPRIQSWEIATKSAVSGEYFYFRTEYNNAEKTQPTFRLMFMDALRAAREDELNDVAILSGLSKNYSYTFILQHPENHIVLNIEHPELYLVAIYDISDKHATAIPLPIFRNWSCFHYIGGIINFPLQYSVSPATTYATLLGRHTSIQNDHSQVGIMITNLETGHRCSLKNPTYINVHTLRGNNPNLLYHYLCLRHMDKVEEFVGYFPRYKKLFYGFYEQYMSFVKNVHQSYIEYYVMKTEQIISGQYMSHIYKLHHSVYLPSLSSDTKIIITKFVVLNYLNGLSPGKMLFALNYPNSC